ncbi:hypothetical protein GF327_05020 [Candidatus Woesearchaeota archaeon]|nr:hypothetical protein [Candidatus Woesearchaeota archaeon]
MFTIYTIVNNKMSSTVATRLPEKDIREIEKFAEEEHTDKSNFLKKLIYKSLREYKIRRAFKLYSQKQISLGSVAKQANVSMWEVFGLMAEYKVNLNYGIHEFKEDIKYKE